MLWEELKSCELKHPKLDANDDWKSQLISDEDYEFWGILFFILKVINILWVIYEFENETEFKKLEKLITLAKENYSIEGIVHGGILSKYQKDNFSSICQKNDLEIISPLWNKNPESYMKELLEENFEYIISSVSCDGLDDSWLGQKIDENGLKTLENLQNKFGFNLNFEGGEAETFVTNCPLFKKPLFIQDSRTEWDGYRGRFEILEAKLKDNAW